MSLKITIGDRSYTYEYRVTRVIFSTGLLTQIKLLYYRKLVK